MTRSIERGIRGYGYMMPLPSDIDENMRKPVKQLGKIVDSHIQKKHTSTR